MITTLRYSNMAMEILHSWMMFKDINLHVEGKSHFHVSLPDVNLWGCIVISYEMVGIFPCNIPVKIVGWVITTNGDLTGDIANGILIE